MSAEVPLSGDQTKLLNDIDLKIIDVQAADIRQAEATASAISALTVVVVAATAATATGFKSRGQIGEAWVLAVLIFLEGAFAAVVGHALVLRMRAAVGRAEGARQRLASRLPNGAAIVADLGDWSVPRTISARVRPDVWLIPMLLQALGGMAILGGVILALTYMPDSDAKRLDF